jgi:hypothetical protein
VFGSISEWKEALETGGSSGERERGSWDGMQRAKEAGETGRSVEIDGTLVVYDSQ